MKCIIQLTLGAVVHLDLCASCLSEDMLVYLLYVCWFCSKTQLQLGVQHGLTYIWYIICFCYACSTSNL